MMAYLPILQRKKLSEVKNRQARRLCPDISIKVMYISQSHRQVELKMKIFNPVADEVQQTLDWLTEQEAAAESLNEVVELLSIKGTAKSEVVKSAFCSYTWWDGDYYCQDENWRWHFVDLSST